jgi:hypothetical protein
MPPKAQQTPFGALEVKVADLQREVSALKDVLNVYENWNSEIKNMYGKQVTILSHTDSVFLGKLIWTDRYCVCIEKTNKQRVILNKGGIVSIELS